MQNLIQKHQIKGARDALLILPQQGIQNFQHHLWWLNFQKKYWKSHLRISIKVNAKMQEQQSSVTLEKLIQYLWVT